MKDEELPSLEEAEATAKAARAALTLKRIAFDAAEAALRLASDELKSADRAYAAAHKILKRVTHLSNGYCAAILNDHAFISQFHYPCANKAKENGYCGVHKRLANCAG